MKIVIFSGGPGNRFWPLSRRRKPKQFLNVIGDKSLLQQRFNLVNRTFSPADIFVSTGREYAAFVRRQLPKLRKENLILEPERKDTAAAVGLAAVFLEKRFPGEPMAILWQDHWVKRPAVFNKALGEAARLAEETGRFVFLPVPALYPQVHRGYIKTGKTIGRIGRGIIHKEFMSFVEKPNLEQARLYLESGNYHWNPGYFVAQPSTVLSMYKDHAPEMHAGLVKIGKAWESSAEESVLRREFSRFEKNSVDYLILNKLARGEAEALVSDMGWFDVGELSSLKEALQEDDNEIVKKGLAVAEGCRDLLLHNAEKDKLVAAVGVEEMVVVNTKDVVLVCHKDKVSDIKKLLKEMEKFPRLRKYL